MLSLFREWVAGWTAELTALIWLVLAFVSAIIEVSVPHFGFAFVGAAAIVAAAAAYFGLSVTIQLVAFVVILTVSILTLRAGLLARLGGPGVPSRTDPLVGKHGVVTHPIDPIVGGGRVNVGGQDWAARSVESIPVGTTVRVTGADGIVLEVTRT
jgi:membrane protein implicated in regulation of membrane protease activity